MIKTAPDLQIISLTDATPGVLEHAHCSAIVAYPDGELLVAYYHAIVEAHRCQAIYGRRKKPGDPTWSAPVVLSKDIKNWRMEGNPVLWIAPDTGKTWLFYITSWGGWSTCVLRAKTSDDKGHTWSGSQKIYGHMSRVSKNPPILTKAGDYILPATNEFRECMALFFLSQNQGKTWHDPGTRLTVPQNLWPPERAQKSRVPARMLDQPTIIERTDGSIFCLMRAYRPLGKMYTSESRDGGRTWTTPGPHILPNPDGGFHMIRLLSGNIAIIYNHSSTERNPLSVALSEDEGSTWHYRQNICEYSPNGDPQSTANFGYPTLIQGSDSIIHATWSLGHSDLRCAGGRATDIQYTSFTENWIKKSPFF